MANPPTSRVIRNPKTRFNWRVSDFIRRMMVWWFELGARIAGRGYYCSTLAGQEDYNITVNSDLTVSCSCQDYDGSGHIGDLRKNSFEEIYFGPVAQKFRDDLAKGKIPIPTCVRCTIHRLEKNPPPRPCRSCRIAECCWKTLSSATWTASAARAKAPPPSAPPRRWRSKIL